MRVDVLLPEALQFHQRDDPGPSFLFPLHVKDLRVYIDALFVLLPEDPLVDPGLKQAADPGQVALAFFGVRVVPENQPDEIVRREFDQVLLMIPGDDVVGGADDPGEVVHIIPVPFERLDGYHFLDSSPAVKV